MHINTNSWHYKWWDLTFRIWGKGTPTHTNLCRYVQRMFWVSLGTILLYAVIASGIISLLVLLATATWHYPLMALVVALGIMTVVAAAIGFFTWLDSENKEIVDAWVEAKTQGVCPLIEFTKGPTKED